MFQATETGKELAPRDEPRRERDFLGDEAYFASVRGETDVPDCDVPDVTTA
jgi:hypothetical protein